MRKIFSALACLSILGSFSYNVVFPQTVSASDCNIVKSVSRNFSGNIFTVEEISTNFSGSSILVKNSNSDELVLKVSSDTLFIDAKSGNYSSLYSLTKGSKIYAYFSNAMTRSLPPQTSALAVITNIDEGLCIPHIIEVDKVETVQNGESLKIYDKYNEFVITATKDSKILDLSCSNDETKDFDRLKNSKKLVVWFSYATLSIPAYTTAQRISILE